MFDMDAFLNTTTKDANDTQLIPIPTGEYTATIKELNLKEWVKEEKSGVILNVTWTINDDSLREQLERENITCKQAIFLDITEDGKLDNGSGKNIGLGKLRAAIGMNEAGKAFSPSMMVGQMAKVRITQRPDKNSDAIYNDVAGVASLAGADEL